MELLQHRKYFQAEYIWVDGQSPTAKIRSKTRFSREPFHPGNLPFWGFDGSSTFQAITEKSDCGLQPVCVLADPFLEPGNVLVLNEVVMPDGTPHPSNTRAYLRSIMPRFEQYEPLFGVEQEYTLFNEYGTWPLRWPDNGFPSQQGRYYCGAGADEAHGRELVNQHHHACMTAGIELFGKNPEVMPAQWEFQMMPLPPLAMCDQLWIARWMLYRLGEELRIVAKLHPKPVQAGDWNGAGAHTNFSTKMMREERGLGRIQAACESLGKFHGQHIQEHVYGEDNHLRLTGRHETCDISTFRWGIGDRGSSIRIPALVAKAGHGYLEDRRPAANMDPYRVCSAILETVCGSGFDADVFSYFKERRGDANR